MRYSITIKKVIIIGLIISSTIIGVKFLGTGKKNNLFNEKIYNERFSPKYKENFSMKYENGKLKDKFKNIDLELNNRKLKASIQQVDKKGCILILSDPISKLERNLGLTEQIVNTQFDNSNLGNYIESTTDLLIHMSYFFYMDQAHKFIEGAKNKRVKTDFYIKDNNLLVVHQSSFYQKRKTLFSFQKNGTIKITNDMGEKQ